jgi:hypothetical protein
VVLALTTRWSRRDWVAGLAVGAVSSFWLAEWPTIGAVIALAFAVPALLSLTVMWLGARERAVR